jgi:predicted dithiol-disulfide oxidoreductase (DUF899 family)
MTDHTIVSREERQAAPDELLKREKQHIQMGTNWRASAASCLDHGREGLPVRHRRRAAGPGRAVRRPLTAADLPLQVFGLAYQAGDPVNSSIADTLDGLLPHPQARDLTLPLVSQAPLDNLQAYKQRMDWSIPGSPRRTPT